jgi:hypothetical protein
MHTQIRKDKRRGTHSLALRFLLHLHSRTAIAPLSCLFKIMFKTGLFKKGNNSSPFIFMLTIWLSYKRRSDSTNDIHSGDHTTWTCCKMFPSSKFISAKVGRTQGPSSQHHWISDDNLGCTFVGMSKRNPYCKRKQCVFKRKRESTSTYQKFLKTLQMIPTLLVTIFDKWHGLSLSSFRIRFVGLKNNVLPLWYFFSKKGKRHHECFSSAFEISINKEINLRNGW